MKKSAIILSILFVSLFSLTAFAEEPMEPGMDMQRPDGQQQDGSKKMMGGKGMMHQQPTMIATSDGGVVILQGPKLVKYDSMLTLVNEVELKGGPGGGREKKWKEMPQGNSGPQPMDDKEIFTILDENPPADAPLAPSEAPQGETLPVGQ